MKGYPVPFYDIHKNYLTAHIVRKFHKFLFGFIELILCLETRIIHQLIYCTFCCIVGNEFLFFLERHSLKISKLLTIVSQPSKCLKFTTFREVCFVIHVEYKYSSEVLETFYNHQFYKR